MQPLASTEMKVEEGGSGLPIANCAGQRDMRSLVCHAVILRAAERRISLWTFPPTNSKGRRAVRALRVSVEAVK
jgi:hypothetical protein